MLLLKSLYLSCFIALCTKAQSSFILSGTENPSPVGELIPSSTSGSYISYTTTRTVSSLTSGLSPNGSMTALSSSMGAAKASASSNAQRGASTTSRPVTLLQGPLRSNTATLVSGNSTLNGTATTGSTASRTSSSETPTNTQPCNNWPEFCQRKYSNITEVAAHNSMFVRLDNAASNQELEVIAQLNDGIRMCMLFPIPLVLYEC